MAWKKGESGNPGGRPKAEHRIQELARKHTEKAVNTLVAVMNDRDATPSARVSAASVILDRGYGRPPQFTTSDPAAFRRANDMSDDELAAIAAGGSSGAAPAPVDPTQLN